MQKNYISPTVEIISFSKEDVVVNLSSSMEEHNTEIDYN